MSARWATAKVGGAIAVVSALAGLILHVVPPLFLGGLVVTLVVAAAIGFAGASAQRRVKLSRPGVVIAMAMIGALSALAIDFALDYRAWRAHVADRAAEILALQSMGLGTTPDIQRRYEQTLAARDLGAFLDAHPATALNVAINGALACAVCGWVAHHGARA